MNGGARKLKLSMTAELMKEQPKRTGRPVLYLTHQESQSGILASFCFLLYSDRVQLIEICCNRRGV